MTEKKQWKRPQDVVTFRTSDPKEMLGKYMPKHAVKTWTEDFRDEDTGDVVSIERNQIVVERGYISQEKLAEIQFAIQAGDIKDVEVSEDDVRDMELYTPAFYSNFMVEIPIFSAAGITKNHFAVRAQTIPQAIQIAAEFGQMYRGFDGCIRATRVVTIDAQIVPDDHACIPEADRKPADERKDYFKVQVRREWVEDMKLKKSDTYYIVAANDVGQAKERIALLLDIMKAEQEKEQGFKAEDDSRTTIRKAMPFEVDCIVPKEFSDMFHEEPTKM
jgi:hypothetical protein